MTIDKNILMKVEKPGRYTGGEWGQTVKDPARVKTSFALAFPDIYEVGMSYLGFKILYHILNETPYVQAERVFSPWPDMQERMKEHGMSLCSLETGRKLADFDLVGITLQYELSFTNILDMLALGGVPVISKDRSEKDPFVIGGGPCVYNPEPMAGFFDIFIIGEGEEVIAELAELYTDWKERGKQGGRTAFLQKAAQVEGLYIPRFYIAKCKEDGTFLKMQTVDVAAPEYVTKRVLKDMDAAPYPTAPIVPFTEIVHDRIMLEVFRGCTRGCRFCHAGMVYRPVREKNTDRLKTLVRELVDNTGYNEISLFSLSTADYSCLEKFLDDILPDMKKEHVSISLPSLRIDSFSVDLAKKVQTVRKSGLTFAPEAGTQRMRDVINKGVTEEDLLNSVGAAFSSGLSSVKLYFMIGLPGETQEDIKGIADLAYKVFDCYQKITGKRNCKITVSVSCFVPKPWTPFQWSRQDSLSELKEKQMYLKELLRSKAISFQYHDGETSVIEGIIARGDRRMGEAIFAAWQQGARFDGWSEYFDYERWLNAIKEAGLTPDFYVDRERPFDEAFPWEHIRPGVTRDFLRAEYEKAQKGILTEDCRHGDCQSCGVCPQLGVSVIDHAQEAGI